MAGRSHRGTTSIHPRNGGQHMNRTKFTVAVAAAGAGVICLAPAAAADDTELEPNTVTVPDAREVAPPSRAGSIRGIIPCVRVGSIRGIIPCIRVGSERGIIPCVRVGVPVVPEARRGALSPQR
jgi:hypothetical protein